MVCTPWYVYGHLDSRGQSGLCWVFVAPHRLRKWKKLYIPYPLSDRGARVAGCDLSYGHGVRFPLFLQHDGHSRLVVGTLVLVENYSL
jgi:hypothetical protein